MTATSPCIEFEGRWYSGDEVTATAPPSWRYCAMPGLLMMRRLGWVVRNRLQHAAAIIDFLAACGAVSMIYSFQLPESIGRDIEKL